MLTDTCRGRRSLDAAGDVDAAANCTAEAEALQRRIHDLESQVDAERVNPKNSDAAMMQTVCAICGSINSLADDADEKHLLGNRHLTWAEIRRCVAELKAKARSSPSLISAADHPARAVLLSASLLSFPPASSPSDSSLPLLPPRSSRQAAAPTPSGTAGAPPAQTATAAATGSATSPLTVTGNATTGTAGRAATATRRGVSRSRSRRLRRGAASGAGAGAAAASGGGSGIARGIARGRGVGGGAGTAAGTTGGGAGVGTAGAATGEGATAGTGAGTMIEAIETGGTTGGGDQW